MVIGAFTMKLHPFIYLCLIILVLTLLNILFVKNGLVSPKKRKKVASLLKSVSVVQLLETSEATILSRIQYPDRHASLLYGHSSHAPLPRELDQGHAPKYVDRKSLLTIGLASVYRKENDDAYLLSTLDLVFNRTSAYEQSVSTVVVCLTDVDGNRRRQRADRLAGRYKKQLSSNLLQIIAPPSNIYPASASNTSSAASATYHDGPFLTRWRTKLALDFAFLFAYSQGLSDYFLNLEDDVVPVDHFVNKTLAFVEEKAGRDQDQEQWVSLRLSSHLSIGRLYRGQTLHKLVAFILTSYASQPVDFLMHYFDVIQLADNYSTDKFLRTPPLFKHIGEVSTKESFEDQDNAEANRHWDRFKQRNPNNVRLFTSIRGQHRNYTLDSAFQPGRGPFFWGKDVVPGDTIDLVLPRPLHLRRFLLSTGFRQEEKRRTRDRLLAASLSASPHYVRVAKNGRARCQNFRRLSKNISGNGTLDFSNFGGAASLFPGGIQCLRVKVAKAETNWLVVKLIFVQVEGQVQTEGTLPN